MEDDEAEAEAGDDDVAVEAWQKFTCHAAVEGKCYCLSKKAAFKWAIAKDRLPDGSVCAIAGKYVCGAPACLKADGAQWQQRVRQPSATPTARTASKKSWVALHI